MEDKGSSAVPPPSSPGPPQPPTTKFTDEDLGPGSYDELHRKCKDIFPICFDGAKFMVNKGLSQHFQVSHTISLSPATNHYKFGATYVGTKQLTPSESYPVLLGDTDLSGNVTATVIHHLTDRIRGKFQAQTMKSKIAGAQGTLEYRGRLQSLGLTVANLDLVSGSGIFVAQYLRKLLPQLDVGMECVYQSSKQIPGGQISNVSYAARYRGDEWVGSGSVGKQGAHLCYYQKVAEGVEVGVEWETNMRLQESVASLAYHYELPKAEVNFRASIDSQWTVGAVLEKKLPPLPFTFALSGMINHTKAQSKFGIGLILG